ncbi:cysteine dioxygenase [Salibacter halophilus]|uniref:Cysteine dioxygenase n=1 Tax=Salibacter halophilus TaxID=1803916 RepID=A0A6N6MAC6_9FLAO|nr:cysteine dioxygenase family protein [Salibacter halophilus]KAB1065216.1 cysteine dioxygenase [Salibacter halophilus]
MSNKITSIEELVEILPSCKGNDFVELAERIDIPLSDYEKYASWCAEKYTRNCIDRTDDYELLLLCWDEGQDTPIHGHGGEECWVLMVDGHLKEIRIKEDDSGNLYDDRTVDMKVGDISYMHDDMGYHSLHNIHNGRSMTLHLYMNPIDRCLVYDDEKEKFEMKDMHYDTIEGEKAEECSVELEMA